MTEFNAKIVVARDHPSLSGHFPGNPIVPGVVLLDLICTEIQSVLPQPTRLVAIASAKFRQPVTPDAIVEVAVSIVGESTHNSRARFLATVNQTLVAEGALVLADAPPDAGH
jgi:3-hydroxyacyl-[acyl-carrier-protein] dehydratase